MEKVKRFFRNLSEKRSYQIVFFVMSMCVIFLGYFVIREKIGKQFVIYEDDFSWVYQVDSVGIEDDRFVMKGFAFQLKEDTGNANYEIVLHESLTGKNSFLKMRYTERKDINDYFLCEYDYLHSGFEAEINEDELSLQKQNYEVLLKIKGRKKAYHTGIYLVNGEMVYANPQEFVQPKVAGTELEDIINNAMLRAYQSDYGVYIYQYEEELYWIMKEDYPFDENGNTVIECHLNTTQIDRLPSHRLENGWNYDNIGFKFIKNEVIYEGVSNYRVAKIKIPTSYAITKISTGLDKKGWVWKQMFRPYYSVQ